MEHAIGEMACPVTQTPKTPRQNHAFPLHIRDSQIRGIPFHIRDLSVTFFSQTRTISMKNVVGALQERCIYCSGGKIIKKGKREKKFETVQLWYCKNCEQVFTPKALKGKTYPISVILDGLAYYYTGYSLERASMRLKEGYGASVSPTTLSRWLKEYKEFCTYSRLRSRGSALFSPHRQRPACCGN
jgi:hypothetical protein